MTRFSKRSSSHRDSRRTGREEQYRGSLVHRIASSKSWYYIMIFLLGFLVLMIFAPVGAFEGFRFSLQYFLEVFSRILTQ